MSEEQYAQRDAVLAEDDFEKLRVVYSLPTHACSCEVYPMRGVLQQPGGEPEAVEFWGVASVYTLEAERGKGNAAKLLAGVAAVAKRASVSALLLMCEVPVRVYSSMGYVAPFSEAHDLEFSSLVSGAPPFDTRVRLLQPGEREAAADTLGSRCNAALKTHAGVAVCPSAAQFGWAVSRDVALRKAVGLPPAPLACGAVCGSALALWAFDAEEQEDGSFRPVLRISAFSPSDGGGSDAKPADAAAVLAAAVRVAHRGGASKALLWRTDALRGDSFASGGATSFWEPPEEALRDLGVASTAIPRTCRSLPMMLPLSERVDPKAWRYIQRACWI